MTVEAEVAVYWQPGCTSCLRAKEYLTRHGIAFRSCNVLADAAAFQELAVFGLKRVPIVAKGGLWVDGQSLPDIARLVGIAHSVTQPLEPALLIARLLVILEGASRYIGQISPADLEATMLPDRPRSLTQLAYHLFNVADAFLEHEQGVPLTFASYCREPQQGTMTKAELSSYGARVRLCITGWWTGPGQVRDWNAVANVYYAEQTLHEYLERTTWHAGQHVRQLMWAMATRLDTPPDRPLGVATFAGLPMPDRIWDPA